MRFLRAWVLRLAGLVRARGRAGQFDAELESHLEMHVDDNLRRGMTPEEARRQALIALGGVQTVRDAYRDRAGVPLLESLAQDVRFALRMLRKAPAFTASAIVVLALGIGANGAVFSLVNAALLKPVTGGRLAADPVGLYSGERQRPDAFRLFSYPEFVDLRSRNDVFTELFAEVPAHPGVTEGDLTRRAAAAYVSANYFRALGVAAPAAGRFFTAAEERPGSGAAVAVVSDSYWRRLGMTADVVGRSITVNGRPLTIVGVAPEGFRGTLSGVTELWLPFGAAGVIATGETGQMSHLANDRSSYSLMLAGTLKPGVSTDEAEARLAPLAAALEAGYPEANRDQRLVVHTRSRWDFGDRPYSDTGLMIGAAVLMAIAGMVLVVACFNLASMQLARGSVRRHEIAVRLALGGSRLRVVRQLFVEGVLLSTIAGIAGTGLAWWAADRITVFIAPLHAVDVAPDGRVLTLVALACVLSALVFSLGPALKVSRPDLVSAMKQAAVLPPTRRRRVSLQGVLVATQVALSLALLVTAGVFARAAMNVAAVDPEFALDGGVFAEVDAGIAGLDDAATRTAYARVLDRLRLLPEVRAASIASIVPLGRIRDARMVHGAGERTAATFTVIGSGYFETLGLRVLSGREFTRVEEQRATEPVAIVDQVLASRLFPGRNPVGELVQLELGDEPDGAPLRVVGVVPSVRDDVVGPAGAHVYVPLGSHFRSMITFHVRTVPGDEAAMMARVREAIHEVDPQLPVLSVRTMAALVSESPNLGVLRQATTLFTAFGVIGLMLSAAGLYGLRAYLVTQRTRELGVRLALGATRGGVMAQLLKEGAVTAAAGIAAGLALAVALVQVLRQSGVLYEVGIVDPTVFAFAPLVLAAVTLAASYIPARRAVRIDPAAALRPE